jgi:hypothetical protein
MEIQLDVKVRLGKGAFGAVFPGTFRGRQVVVKRVDLFDANGNEEETLKQLDHPHIAKTLSRRVQRRIQVRLCRKE